MNRQLYWGKPAHESDWVCPAQEGTPGPYSMRAHQSPPVFLSSEHGNMTKAGMHTPEVALPASIAVLSSQPLTCDANGKSLKQAPLA